MTKMLWKFFRIMKLSRCTSIGILILIMWQTSHQNNQHLECFGRWRTTHACKCRYQTCQVNNYVTPASLVQRNIIFTQGTISCKCLIDAICPHIRLLQINFLFPMLEIYAVVCGRTIKSHYLYSCRKHLS